MKALEPAGADAPATGDGRASNATAAGRAASTKRSASRARSPRRDAEIPRARGARGGLGDMLPLGERPRAPWYPLPLSELLILVGAIGTVIGLSRGVSNGAPPLIAGLVAVAIGTVEVTLREHLSGYRSHAIIIAVLPVIVLDTALALLIVPLTAALKVGMLVCDAALFAFIYKLLRARFLDARRERTFTGNR
jgi:hypothetical protein